MKQKGLRKLVSMILAVVMVLAMSITGFAADITITGAQSGHTYTAYQIFKGELSTDGTVLSDVEWGDNVTDSDNLLSALKSDSTLSSDFTSCATAQDVANVLAGYDDDSAKLIAFAAVVEKYVSSGTVLNESTDNRGKVIYVASGLVNGYYLVVDTKGSLAEGDAISRYIIEIAGTNVKVATKTVYPTIEKTVDDVDGSVQVGQIVTYTITGKVPDTTGYSTYTYEVSDTMSEGLTFDFSSVSVKIGTDTITPTSSELSFTDSDEDGVADGFKLTLDMTNYQEYKDQTITITYTAKVNESAVAEISTNSATLKYSNNPNSDTTSTTTTEEVEVYSAQIVIDKYASDDTEDTTDNKRLAGATFVLYKLDTDNTTKLYYAYDETTDTVSWVGEEQKTSATPKTTDNYGAATFIGLEDGTYYLEETNAPDGYNSLSAPVSVTINGSSASSTDKSSLTMTAEIVNEAGSTLPSTGGMGTTIFYIVGGVLVLGAAVLFVTKKRLGSEN